MYLLDTNVVSEFRKNKPHGAVLAWIQSVAGDEIFIPAVVIGEMQVGAERTRRQDPAKATEIDWYIERILSSYSVLALDAIVFREWARLIYGKSRELTEDAMIAATARVNRLTVVTRNVKDFQSFDVQTLDPFTYTNSKEAI